MAGNRAADYRDSTVGTAVVVVVAGTVAAAEVAGTVAVVEVAVAAEKAGHCYMTEQAASHM